MKRRSVLYWPAICVAGLTVAAGAHLFIRQGSYVWGAIGVLLGVALAVLATESLKTRRNT